MTSKLRDLLENHDRRTFATNTGTRTHARMQHVTIDGVHESGDAELIRGIKSCPGLAEYFSAQSRTEVPVAGYINGRFISRRIDRMHINPATKTITVLDYKTDSDKSAFHDKYVAQLNEYRALLRKIYPDHTISCRILWIHDWTVEIIN